MILGHLKDTGGWQVIDDRIDGAASTPPRVRTDGVWDQLLVVTRTTDTASVREFRVSKPEWVEA